jgi:hypothetical protein
MHRAVCKRGEEEEEEKGKERDAKEKGTKATAKKRSCYKKGAHAAIFLLFLQAHAKRRCVCVRVRASK